MEARLPGELQGPWETEASGFHMERAHPGAQVQCALMDHHLEATSPKQVMLLAVLWRSWRVISTTECSEPHIPSPVYWFPVFIRHICLTTFYLPSTLLGTGEFAVIKVGSLLPPGRVSSPRPFTIWCCNFHTRWWAPRDGLCLSLFM